MKRILIIGNPGSGKSTLAVKLGCVLNLPVTHLDEHFWKDGWVESDKDSWRETLHDFVSRDKWIIDGNYHGSLDFRSQYADTIIYLDFPTIVCFCRIIKRIILNYHETRPDMAPGCPERFNLSFFRWAWRFRKDIRPFILKSINSLPGDKRIIVLNNSEQVSVFLNEISS